MRRCAAIVLVLTVMSSVSLFAHCEIPCGIYDDDARFKSIAEDLRTIEKSMAQIQALSVDPGKNMNQLVRWVNNKETHADHIRDTISQYFLAQRIKAPAAGDEAGLKEYTQNLTLLHKMIVAAMKCKQTVDQKHPKELHDLLHKFQGNYQK